MDVSFRLATVADIELLLGFMPEFYEGEHLAFDERAAHSALQKILSDEGLGKIWLIQLGEIAIGYIVLTLGYSLEFHGRDACIDEIYVRAQYQGRASGEGRLHLSKMRVALSACGHYIWKSSAIT